MNEAAIYRPNNRRLIWVAFACAITIHVGAIAIAQSTSKPPGLTWHGELDDTVIGTIDPPPQPPEPEIILPTEPAVIEDQEFPEENVTRTAIRPRKKVSVTAAPRSIGLGTGRAMSVRSAKALSLYAPRPNYPYEARRGGVTGSGIAELTVNSATGTVIDARMSQSTGSAILDRATVETLRTWRFKPGVADNVDVPITYTLSGVSY
jgi:TonB family protein